MLMTKKAGQTFFDCFDPVKKSILNTYTNENLVIAIGDNAIREKVSLNTIFYQMPISLRLFIDQLLSDTNQL